MPGRASHTCLEFAQRGASVGFNYVDMAGRDVTEQALLTETAIKGLGVGVYSARCDVRDHNAVAHFFTEVRYKGAKTVAITPDYSEVAKLCDVWLHPKQGTDAALAMALGGHTYGFRSYTAARRP